MTDPRPGSAARAFSPRTVLALVLIGGFVFAALLWSIGTGMAGGPVNNGGSHAGGTGLNGYAALAELLDRQGYSVRRSRSERSLDAPGLLVLTPPHHAKADEIDRIVAQRRHAGPTLLILPKWNAMRVPASMRPPEARDGWVILGGASKPGWGDNLELSGPLDVRIDRLAPAQARWRGLGHAGALPASGAVQSIEAARIIPLVRDGQGQILAGYIDDGQYPALERAAGAGSGTGRRLYPVVIVAEPDLMNNYGFADRNRAMLALDMMRAAMGDRKMPITFDLTLNGLGRSANLLTLAFSPPFLAATLCLVMAALALGWRAFLRFGPPRRAGREIAFGKRALVANTGGLIRRTGRIHLLAGPYLRRARERLARAFGLPRGADMAAIDAAIDRALAARRPDADPFSAVAARLSAARTPHDLIKAAKDIHALERTLQR